MKRNEEDHTCWCDDPQNPGHKLWLCGKEICIKLLDKGRLPAIIVLVDDEEE